jgi:hypothetical protein
VCAWAILLIRSTHRRDAERLRRVAVRLQSSGCAILDISACW